MTKKNPYFVLFIATALSITAMPILGRIIMEFQLSQTPLGVLTISAAAVDDALGWILLASVSAAVNGSFEWLPVLGMLLLLGLFVAAVSGATMKSSLAASVQPGVTLFVTSTDKSGTLQQIEETATYNCNASACVLQSKAWKEPVTLDVFGLAGTEFYPVVSAKANKAVVNTQGFALVNAVRTALPNSLTVFGRINQSSGNFAWQATVSNFAEGSHMSTNGSSILSAKAGSSAAANGSVIIMNPVKSRNNP